MGWDGCLSHNFSGFIYLGSVECEALTEVLCAYSIHNKLTIQMHRASSNVKHGVASFDV